MSQSDGATKQLLIISPNADRFFSKFFHRRRSSEFLTKSLLHVPPHFKRVVTLAYEILLSENWRKSETDIVINGRPQGRVATRLRRGGSEAIA